MALPRPKLRLHQILLVVFVVILILPLGGIYYLRLYEDALIRQTETELIAQAAFIRASYKARVLEALKIHPTLLSEIGSPIATTISETQQFDPIPAEIDMTKDPILPPRPNGQQSNEPVPNELKAIGQDLTPVLQDAQKVTMAGMKILDRHGIVIAGQKELGLSFKRLPEIDSALKGHHASLIRERILTEPPPPLESLSRGSGTIIYVALPVVVQNQLIGVVWVSRTPKDIAKALYEKRGSLWGSGSLILGVTILLALLTGLTITRPINALVAQANAVTSGKRKTTQPLIAPMTYEIAVLSEAIATMAETIQQRSDYIQTFATRISHEFKTPLTALQGSLELLETHWETMTEEKRKHFLNNMAQDTDRLNRLVTRLLTLARADMETNEADAVELLPLLKPFESRYQDFGLTVALPTLQDSPWVAMSQEVCEMIVTNLLDNSLQHGATQVDILIETGKETVTLTLSDNGSGISPTNLPQVLDPFFTTRRESGGTGLGLSIVKALLTNHHGTITLYPSNPGLSLKLTLPRVQPEKKRSL